MLITERHHPASRDESVGVIDIGSNSVRLVVYHAPERVPLPVYNEKYLCYLGRDLDHTGQLYPEGKASALEALRRYTAMAKRLKVGSLHVIATAALRDAKDGPAFVSEIEKTFALNVVVIAGKREAELAGYGVLASFSQPEGLVADLGGGSLELANIENSQIYQSLSYPLGALRLLNNCGSDVPALERVISQKLIENTVQHSVLYAVGGSFRAIAKAHRMHSAYPLELVHHYTMARHDLINWIDYVVSVSEEDLALIEGIPAKRAHTIVPAAVMLRCLVTHYGIQQIVFSVAGIREGLLFSSLTSMAQEEDPLLASAAELAAMAGRVGGYASELFSWMSPLFTGETARQSRLRKAFCLLAEVAWTIDPNFRERWAYHRVLQSSMKGLNHEEMVMLALAMHYRHTSKLVEPYEEMALLNHDQQQWSQRVGRSGQLAFMLSGGMRDALPHSTLHYDMEGIRLSGDEAMTSSAAVTKKLDALEGLFNATSN